MLIINQAVLMIWQYHVRHVGITAKKNTTFTTMDHLRDYNYHHGKGVSLDQLPICSRTAYPYSLLCNLSYGDIVTPTYANST